MSRSFSEALRWASYKSDPYHTNQNKPRHLRDPYIIHLNIALYMVVSLYFDGKSHVSNGCNIYLLRSPASSPRHPSDGRSFHQITGSGAGGGWDGPEESTSQALGS